MPHMMLPQLVVVPTLKRNRVHCCGNVVTFGEMLAQLGIVREYVVAIAAINARHFGAAARRHHWHAYGVIACV